MRWRKCDLWKASIVVAGVLLLLLLMMWVPLSAASAHEETSGWAMPGTVTVQATPTEDATVTALNKEKLMREVTGQQHTWDNWLWSNAATISSTLVIVIGALFGLWRWRRDQHTDLEKRAEERFQSAVSGLGDEKEGARIGAAILLRTFLRPGYEQFYSQTFDLAVANLRLPRTLSPPEDPSTALPLTTLSQALIVVFKEAFPLARDQVKSRSQTLSTKVLGRPSDAQMRIKRNAIQELDARGIQLDHAFLQYADLKQMWMPQASLRAVDLREAELYRADLREAELYRADLREADLREANLSGVNLSDANLHLTNLRYADLSEVNLNNANLNNANLSNANLSNANLSNANLSNANLRKSNLEEALSLKDTNLRGVRGLTKEQLVTCQAKGAIID